jgi:phosphoadenosine phosphosulfate reductase
MSEVVDASAVRAAPIGNPFDQLISRLTVAEAQNRQAAADLADAFRKLDLFARVAAICEKLSGRIVFTTSFGLEDQAIAHAIFAQELPIEVVTLDTGRLFPETFDVWAATERRYAARIAAFTPNDTEVEALIGRQGINGFRASVGARLECCAIRKVAPLARALNGAGVWIAGIRADQSSARARVAAVSFDEPRQLIKAHPLFDWTRDQALTFVRGHGVPYNALHDRGFPSVGCAPCTRAVAPGEPERAGRWWWEQDEKTECGLHPSHPARRAAAVQSRVQS